MLWSPDSVIAADIPAITGLCSDSAIKVFLKLKPVKDGTPKIRYKVKDAQTIVLEGPQRLDSVGNPDLRLFVFDGIEDTESTTSSSTHPIVNDSVKALLEGYNISFMTYGQDGSGKTYSMFGDDSSDGLVQSTCKKLFTEIRREEEKNVTFALGLSIVEVYCGEVRDLISFSDHAKSLKLRADSTNSTLELKGLRSVAISSPTEILAYLKRAKAAQNSNEKHVSSRATFIIKITIHQRNIDDETIKASTLMMIDLASSDKIGRDSNLLLSTEAAKKMNGSIDAIENVARSLAGSKATVNDSKPNPGAHKVPYKESSLTQLLQEVIGGNYRTTVLLTCSTRVEDEEETLNSLNFGANMKLVKNPVHQNKSGFNSKKILDLLVKDFGVEHSNYLAKIELLQNEMTLLRRKEQNKDHKQLDRIMVENEKLKKQVDSLSQLLNSDGKKSADEEHTKIVETLMEKCENVIQLQMKLDVESSRVAHLQSELDFKLSKEQALETMNLKLLHQMQENEDELKEVLASNYNLKQEIEKWQKLAATSLEKSDSLESLANSSLGRQDERRRRSFASSAGSFMAQIDESPQLRKSSWFFGHATSSNKATRQVSVSSTGSSASQEFSRPKGLKNGINLNAVSGDGQSSSGK